jgi:putative ABC transport system permease protein
VNAVAAMAAAGLLLLTPLVVAGVRRRTLLTMATRNVRRRRAEAALVVAGAMLGTAIITSSLVVGDMIHASYADAARTGLGPVDLTLTSGDDTALDAAAEALAAARIPEVDGLLQVTASSVALAAPGTDAAVPQVHVVELDPGAGRALGHDPDITGLADVDGLAKGQIVLNAATAEELGVGPGADLRLHAYGAEVPAVVRAVVPEVGLAGYGGALLPEGTLAELAGRGSATGLRPEPRLLVSASGGVFDTEASSEVAARAIRGVLGDLPVAVETTKADLLEAAEREASGLGEIFTVFGTFSVLAGVLLLVNLFVMLAEERKTELGVLRAVGFTRRLLVRSFAIEGALYAIAASMVGAVAGIGIGWVVASIAAPIFAPDQGTRFPLVVEPGSLALGAGAGLVISLLTIWATSLRIARLNIVRAIRDLPEPRTPRGRTRSLLLGGVGVLLGAAIAVAGYLGDAAIPLLVGVPLALFSAAPLLRRLLPERLAQLAVAGAVLAWGLSAYALFDDIVGTDDMGVLVVQGIVLTAGAVTLAAGLDRTWSGLAQAVLRGGRGLAARLGLAYPLARRFRTAMLLGMFSLVIFTMTILSAVTAVMERNTDATVAQVGGGFDVVLDVNPTTPLDVAALEARDEVSAVAGVQRGAARFGTTQLDEPRTGPVSGFDGALVREGPPALTARGDAYATDADAYRAVLQDPTLAIVPEDFLVGGVEGGVIGVGDRLTVAGPAGGEPRELTVVGLTGPDLTGSGAWLSTDLVGTVLGGEHALSRSYIALIDGADVTRVAADLNARLLEDGADARPVTAIAAGVLGALTGFIGLLRGFLGLGLLVGIAGLGVVMVRAVRERRHEIGMLRAMGFPARLVRAAMLWEAGLIAAQGTAIGAALGLFTARQMLASSDSFGDAGASLVIPWVELLVLLALPFAASLAAAAGPAWRAAAIRPAVALRTAD